VETLCLFCWRALRAASARRSPALIPLEGGLAFCWGWVMLMGAGELLRGHCGMIGRGPRFATE